MNRCSQVKRLCHVEFQGVPEDAQNWFVGSTDIHNAFHKMRIPGRLQAFFAMPAVLASEVGYTGRTVDQKRLAPDSPIYLVPATHPMRFSWVMFFCEDVADHCTITGSADSFCFSVTIPHHHCSVANMAWDRLVSVGRMLTILGFGSR